MNLTHFIQRLFELSKHKVLILDGAMGTQIMARNLDEKDFRGRSFASHPTALKGCNDVLSLTAPDIIMDIHRRYLEAGADIIETNSFNCNVFSLADYGLSDRVADLALAAATTAREAADRYMRSSGREVWVAGSMGPTSKSLTMEVTAQDSAMTAESLTATYRNCAGALINGGVDLLIIETVFDTLNAKCAIAGAKEAMEAAGLAMPIILSATLTESGRLLSGMSLEGFSMAIEHAGPFAVTLNCGFGVEGMVKPLELLQGIPCLTGIYPNAGLPDQMGRYNESPESIAAKIRPLLQAGMLNIVGGCCGTTPEHIAAIASVAGEFPPREVPSPEKNLHVSGLEPMRQTPGAPFIVVGERCNVAGSRKFLRLVKEGDIAGALAIARAQVAAGAAVLDINMDDALLDGAQAMTSFLKALTADAELAAVPVMIDSADFTVIEEALKLLQGRSIVNSISLKEGEETFVKRAKTVKKAGAVPVVMAFDEKGQALDTPRRVEIFTRAMKLLTSADVGFREDEIILDPNILAVCTGIDGHDRLALEFIESVAALKKLFPTVNISGGVSNLSFAFRGNNAVREAMHAVFLHHAAAKGLDMAIVNPSAPFDLEKIEPRLKAAVEKALFKEPSPFSTQELVAIASELQQLKPANKATITENALPETPDCRSAAEKLSEAIVRSDFNAIPGLVEECLRDGLSPMEIVDGALMNGMNRVGELFGKGVIFLPQVVRSATAMKEAVTVLQPLIEKGVRIDSKRRKMVLATVKGDVHDIGKNLVATVMRCNGWDVTDLGVMVEPQRIIEAVRTCGADALGLSGLITPSLAEMALVARMMQDSGLDIPLCVGGATTSAIHTAVKIAPEYPAGLVLHTSVAASLPPLLNSVLSENGGVQAADIKARQQLLRDEHAAQESAKTQLTLEEARARRVKETEPSPKPLQESADMQLSVGEVAPFINWRAFLGAWEMPVSLHKCDCGHVHIENVSETEKMIVEAKNILQTLEEEGAYIEARVRILPAKGVDETIVVNMPDRQIEIPTPRQLKAMPEGRPQLSLADFLAETDDYLGFFAVTTAGPITRRIEKLKRQGDTYKALLLQSLADRLVEAATEVVHYRVRTQLWGYSPGEKLEPETFMQRRFRGIRPALGYPSLPDQRVIFLLDKILDYNSLGISPTVNGAMNPAASTTGLLFASPHSRYFSTE